MSMYNLIGYINNYSKTSGSIWQYHKDLNDNMTDSGSFKFKSGITEKNPCCW